MCSAPFVCWTSCELHSFAPNLRFYWQGPTTNALPARWWASDPPPHGPNSPGAEGLWLWPARDTLLLLPLTCRKELCKWNPPINSVSVQTVHGRSSVSVEATGERVSPFVSELSHFAVANQRCPPFPSYFSSPGLQWLIVGVLLAIYLWQYAD